MIPFCVDRDRVDKLPTSNALPAVEIFAGVKAERTLEQVDAEALVDVVKLGGELKVCGRRAGSVGTARRHSQTDINCHRCCWLTPEGGAVACCCCCCQRKQWQQALLHQCSVVCYHSSADPLFTFFPNESLNIVSLALACFNCNPQCICTHGDERERKKGEDSSMLRRLLILQQSSLDYELFITPCDDTVVVVRAGGARLHSISLLYIYKAWVPRVSGCLLSCCSTLVIVTAAENVRRALLLQRRTYCTGPLSTLGCTFTNGALTFGEQYVDSMRYVVQYWMLIICLLYYFFGMQLKEKNTINK